VWVIVWVSGGKRDGRFGRSLWFEKERVREGGVLKKGVRKKRMKKKEKKKKKKSFFFFWFFGHHLLSLVFFPLLTFVFPEFKGTEVCSFFFIHLIHFFFIYIYIKKKEEEKKGKKGRKSSDTSKSTSPDHPIFG
jgi:hypothetical protein